MSNQVTKGLAVKIGSSTLRAELLKSAAKETGCRIPANWSSNKFYAELEAEGLVTEGRNVIPGWQKQWLITDAGRWHLRDPVSSQKRAVMTEAGIWTIIGLQFLGLMLVTWRCDILSRRIDTVHKRITLNNRMNGLRSGGWDPEETAAPRITTFNEGSGGAVGESRD